MELKQLAQQKQGIAVDGDRTFSKTSNWLTPTLNKIQTAMKVKGIEIITGEHNSQGRRTIKIINHNL